MNEEMNKEYVEAEDVTEPVAVEDIENVKTVDCIEDIEAEPVVDFEDCEPVEVTVCDIQEVSGEDEAPQIEVSESVASEPEQPFGDVNVADESTLSIDGGVVEKIVAMTCRSVDGILQMKGNLISSIQEGFRGSDSRKGVSVEMSGDDTCTVSVSIIMEYGKSAPRIFQELHDKISSTITTMTGLKVAAVNVRVTNVMTRAEAESHRRKDKGSEE